ncbi:MAG: hypothetical protein HZB13_12315 [Acidobacteria bacterium]|nr:hypothetical protein [Acidobacteriota bacterium]
MEESLTLSYWANLASSYRAVGPPLHPSLEDIAAMESAVREWARGNAPPRLEALLLGITPMIARMRWPRPVRLLAADNSIPMLRAVWPGDIPRRRYGICASWLDLPRPAHSCDIVLGDGPMICMRYPDGFRSLSRSVCRVLKPDGIFVLRCYVQPALREDADAVFADALRGSIPTFHQFKFRLLMALQKSASSGVKVDDVYRYWTGRVGPGGRWPSRAGWRKKDVGTIELYRGAGNVHTFPTLEEWRSVLEESFEFVSTSCATYHLADRCPVVVLRHRRGRVE